MENQITYSTLGSCVTRDSIELCDKDKMFRHIRNIAFVSPATYSKTLPADDIPVLEEKINQLEISEFRKRCFLKDMKGQTVDYVCEEKSDYLIIDFYGFSYNILKLDDDHSVTYGSIGDKKLYEILSEYYSDKGFKIVSSSELPVEDIYKELDILCDRLLRIWEPSHIIVMVAHPAAYYVDSSLLKVFPGHFCYGYPNYLMKNMSRYVINKIKCRRIDIPAEYKGFVIGDKANRWGLHPLHYPNSVYNYFFDKICEITVKDYQSNGKKLLDNIKYTYYNLLPHKDFTPPRVYKRRLVRPFHRQRSS